MAQLIAAILIFIAACYALSALFYSLLLAVPAAVIISLISTMVAPSLIGSKSATVKYELQDHKTDPQLLRVTTPPDARIKILYSILASLIPASIVMFIIGNHILEAPNSNEIWVRKVGVAVSVVITIFFCFWFWKTLERSLCAAKSESVEPLEALLRDYAAKLRSLNESGKPFNITKLAQWEDILVAATQPDLSATNASVAIVLKGKLKDIDAMALQLSKIDCISNRIRRLARDVSTKAVRLSATSLLHAIDEIARVADSASWAQGFSSGHSAKLLTDLESAERKLQELDRSIEKPEQRNKGKRDSANQREDGKSLNSTMDAFAFLGVPSDASRETINYRLKRLSSFWHPDKVKAEGLVESEYSRYEEMMKQINQARQILQKDGKI